MVFPQLVHRTFKIPKHDHFVHDYTRYGFLYVAKKYGDLGFNYRITQLKKLVKSIIRHESK